MTPAEEKENEPTAVQREVTEKITEGGKKSRILKQKKNELQEVVWQKELLVLLKLVMNMNNVLLDQTDR
jgi:hypothetical protein